MQTFKRTQTVYNFKNTCDNCFNDIEFPLLGDFTEGQLIFQTLDAQDFCIASLVNNLTFDFIIEALEKDKQLVFNRVDAKKILIFIADKLHNQGFALDYPICPICKKTPRHFNDNIRTNKRELNFVTWHNFENLTLTEKTKRVEEAIATIE